MKKILYIILIALLSVVAGLAKATPLSGSGTETAPYIIATTADWTEFCDNHATYKNSYIKMANFVTAATNKYFNDTFSGTFDGDGYTLTVNISGGQVAPFKQVSNGTIKNLRVAGSITGSANHTSGLICFCTNNTTCTIQNCIVSATITNTENLGGFIGHGTAATTINMTDCVFNGTLNYSGASNGTNKNDNTFSKKVGGFVSWEGNGTTIFNLSRCLFDGTINCTAGFTPFIVKYSGCNVTGCDAASCLYTVAQSSGFPATYTIFNGTSAIGQTANQIVTTMNNAGGNGWRVFKGKVEPTMRPLRTLGNIPDGWTVTANGDTITVTNGTAIITEGDTVLLFPPQAEIDFVKSVTLTDAPAPSCRLILLDTVQHNLVAQDCDTLTGELQHNVKISIADGATVTLDGVSINANGSWTTGNYAGITCLGDATIILKDGTTNTVTGFRHDYPGIFVPQNKTLTIKGETAGTGTLTARSNVHPADDCAAGIGAGYGNACGNILIESGAIAANGGKRGAGIGGAVNASCGTITINGGTVDATGGAFGAGIGSGGEISYSSDPCGTITIKGGTVTATGGEYGAGIGSGDIGKCQSISITGGIVIATGGSKATGIGSGNYGTCAGITIANTVTSVTAIKGTDATNSIGAGNNGSCGTVTFGTQLMYDGSDWTTIPTSGQTYGGLKFIIKTTSINNDTWELTCRRVDLSHITADSIMQDGDVLTGTLTANVKISIANGATVTLDNASINADGNMSGSKAGITCLGNVTIVLSGTNTVKGFNASYPGIFVPQTQTLVIKGSGSLHASTKDGNGGAGIGGGDALNCGNIEIQSGTITAKGSQYGAGIGGGNSANCGNITISGGTVNATGGYRAPGIGSGRRGVSGTQGQYNSGSCGNITISGGTITATGGEDAAGIGGGRGNNNNYKTSCGTITITSGVTSVTATKGEYAPNSIGAGGYGTCGTVTIGSATGAITDSPYTYPPQP